MPRLLSLQPALSRGLARRTLRAAYQGASVCRLLVPGAERRRAWRELCNWLAAFEHFRHPDAVLGVEVSSTSLNECVRRASELTEGASMWATEGFGYLQAQNAWAAGDEPRGLLTGAAADGLPTRVLLALEAGVCLSLASHLVATLPEATGCHTVRATVERYLELARSNAGADVGPVAANAFGVATRSFAPQHVREVERQLTEELRPPFWHGVGRGLYFSYPRALSRGPRWPGIDLALREAPDSRSQLDAVAGFCWPLTLLSLHDPAILESFLRHHGDTFAGDGALAAGIASALLVRYGWAGRDAVLLSFLRHRPRSAVAGLWEACVRRPSKSALAAWGEGPLRRAAAHALFSFHPEPGRAALSGG